MATTQVRLKEYGADLIEVADNGAGISPSDYHALTLKYHTSKLQDFTDLQVSSSLAFVCFAFCFTALVGNNPHSDCRT